jgi:hypothetical protein
MESARVPRRVFTHAGECPAALNRFGWLRDRRCWQRTFPGAAFGDEYDGHGTHVAGSVLGALPADPLLPSAYSGMAPDAKLSFDDLSPDGGDSALVDIGDLNARLFPHAYALGARIHSLSFGSDSNFYDSAAMELDEFASDHEDHLVLVAAGNSGPGYYTVGSPAVAKSSLAVGASGQSTAGLLEYGVLRSLALRIVGGAEGSLGTPMALVPAEFGAAVAEGGELWTGPLALPEPPDACAPVNASLAGKVALVKLGTCTFVDMVLHVQRAGALAVVSYAPSLAAPIVMGGASAEATIPAVRTGRRCRPTCSRARSTSPSPKATSTPWRAASCRWTAWRISRRAGRRPTTGTSPTSRLPASTSAPRSRTAPAPSLRGSAAR